MKQRKKALRSAAAKKGWETRRAVLKHRRTEVMRGILTHAMPVQGLESISGKDHRRPWLRLKSAVLRLFGAAP